MSLPIEVLPHTFTQGGKDELFLTCKTEEDARTIMEFLEERRIKMMWIEPQDSFGPRSRHALRIEAEEN